MKARFPAVIAPAIIFGAACWTSSVVFFLGQAMAQTASTRPYSLAANYISDLGNTSCGPAVCSPLHGLMNGTFVLVGLLHSVGAITTPRAWPRRPVSIIGLALLALAGAGLIVAGLAPENESIGAHATGAFIGLVSLNLAMIVLGAAVLGAVRWLGVAALAAGAAGLVGFGLFLNRAPGVPIGAAERIADYPSAVMVVVLGAFVLAAAVSVGRRAGERADIASPPAPR